MLAGSALQVITGNVFRYLNRLIIYIMIVTEYTLCSKEVTIGFGLGRHDPTSVIVVPNNFKATQGVELQPGVFVGKHLSHGLQVGRRLKEAIEPRASKIHQLRHGTVDFNGVHNVCFIFFCLSVNYRFTKLDDFLNLFLVHDAALSFRSLGSRAGWGL